MGVVGAEVSSVLAVLLDPLGHLLQNVSLSAGHANVRGGVGSSLQHELHVELLTGSLHDGHAAAHGLISHVTGEGNVHEGVAAQLVSSADDQVAAGDEVVVADQVSSGADLGQVLMGLTGNADDVRAGLLDLAESLSGAGNSLVHDDGLHLRIGGQVHDVLNGGLQLFGEVVGINGQRDHILAILRLESLGAAAVVLRLRDGAGHDADLVLFGGFTVVGGVVVCAGGVVAAAGHQGEHHGQGKQQTQYFFHTYLLIFHFFAKQLLWGTLILPDVFIICQ